MGQGRGVGRSLLGVVDWSPCLAQKVSSAYKNGLPQFSVQTLVHFDTIKVPVVSSKFVSQVFRNRIYRKEAEAMSVDLS